MRKFGSNTTEKEAKNEKIIPKRCETKRNKAKILFVSQTEAKIMRNCVSLPFRMKRKKNSSEKGTP
jgi:hypothetical protein